MTLTPPHASMALGPPPESKSTKGLAENSVSFAPEHSEDNRMDVNDATRENTRIEETQYTLK
jgi:hypothetical protein